MHTNGTLFVFVSDHGWGKVSSKKNSIAHDAEDTTNRIIITTSAQLIFPALAARSFCFSVLPGSIEIMDRWGRAINRTTIGPMEEGDDVILSCRVVGGEQIH